MIRIRSMEPEIQLNQGAAPILTIFEKTDNGLLSKCLSVADDGSLVKDSSHCAIGRGTWTTRIVASDHEFVRILEELPSSRAIALGAMNEVLESRVLYGDRVANGPVVSLVNSSNEDVFFRTKDCMSFPHGREGRMFLDGDFAKAPPALCERIAEGDF